MHIVKMEKIVIVSFVKILNLKEHIIVVYATNAFFEWTIIVLGSIIALDTTITNIFFFFFSTHVYLSSIA